MSNLQDKYEFLNNLDYSSLDTAHSNMITSFCESRSININDRDIGGRDSQRKATVRPITVPGGQSYLKAFHDFKKNAILVVVNRVNESIERALPDDIRYLRSKYVEKNIKKK
mgnify:CR=1 FL=1